MNYERRQVVVQISQNVILDMFQMGQYGMDFVLFPYLPELPKDYRILGIQASDMSGTFLLKVEHPSFDLVPDGEILPFWQDRKVAVVEYRRIPMERIADEPGIR